MYSSAKGKPLGKCLGVCDRKSRLAGSVSACKISIIRSISWLLLHVLFKEKFRSLIEDMIRNSEGEPTEYYGYDRERQFDEPPFELPAEGLVCIVSNIVENNQQRLIEESEALDYGREQLGVISYCSSPIFEIF